jgi:ligand-binding sensor protein
MKNFKHECNGKVTNPPSEEEEEEKCDNCNCTKNEKSDKPCMCACHAN